MRGLVQVGGLGSDGLEARNKILASVNGLALRVPKTFRNEPRTDGESGSKPYGDLHLSQQRLNAGSGDTEAQKAAPSVLAAMPFEELESIVSRIINT